MSEVIKQLDSWLRRVLPNVQAFKGDKSPRPIIPIFVDKWNKRPASILYVNQEQILITWAFLPSCLHMGFDASLESPQSTCVPSPSMYGI